MVNSSTLETVRTFLNEDKLKFHELDDRIYLSMSDSAGTFQARLLEVNECFVCLATFPVRVPDAARAAAAELLERLNWSLVVGSWEMDWTNGEVRYRTSTPVRNAPLMPAQARDLCYINFQTFARVWRPLLDVIAGTHTPPEAIEAERRRDADARAEFDRALEKTGFKADEEPTAE